MTTVQWRPDPTFYPSPKMAMEAPSEKLAYLALLNPKLAGKPDVPHAHMERRYLIVPGLRSSRIHVIDTKPDPRQPKIVKVIEPETLARRTGYSRPHTVHCGPDGIYLSALGSPAGDGPEPRPRVG